LTGRKKTAMAFLQNEGIEKNSPNPEDRGGKKECCGCNGNNHQLSFERLLLALFSVEVFYYLFSGIKLKEKVIKFCADTFALAVVNEKNEFSFFACLGVGKTKGALWIFCAFSAHVSKYSGKLAKKVARGRNHIAFAIGLWSIFEGHYFASLAGKRN